MIHHGDLFDVLPTLDAESIDACVTDPPYGIGFMGKQWDTFRPGVEAERIVPNRAIASENPNMKGRTRGPASSPSAVEYDRSLKGQHEFEAWTMRWAVAVFRVLKPGAHAVVCGAPRSHHRMISGLEDAGFEVRDCFAWLFGQGFPKSLNVGDGRGTALKPAHEPIALVRKPFKGTLKANLQGFGTGALNIDACRIGGQPWTRDTKHKDNFSGGKFHASRDRHTYEVAPQAGHDSGRWPANVLLDEDAAAMVDAQSGELVSGGTPFVRAGIGYRGHGQGQSDVAGNDGDRGGASRFFYTAKPSRSERDIGCWELPARSGGEATDRTDGTAGLNNPRAGAGRTGRARNIHPTVKPIDLMRWLVRLVTPPDGIVLDPFTGSGTTGCACALEGRRFVGIEREAEYVAIAERRIAQCAPLFNQPLVDPDREDFICGKQS